MRCNITRRGMHDLNGQVTVWLAMRRFTLASITIESAYMRSDGCRRPSSYAALTVSERHERGKKAARGMADEQLILNIMQQAYEASKIALGPLDWRPDRQKVRYLRMPIACDCAGFNVTGVSITATAWADEPDERVSFQLHIDISGNDYRIARVDWRPRQPHTNKVGPPDLRGISPYTSIHDFPENAALGLDVMQNKNLPVAKPIEPEPPDFNALLLYIGDTLKIENAREIPEPPWAPVLHV